MAYIVATTLIVLMLTVHFLMKIQFRSTANSSLEVSGLMSDICYFCCQFQVLFIFITAVISSLLSSDEQLSIVLSWPATDNALIYEVGYSIWLPDAQQCANGGNIDTLPDGYTLFGNTTDSSIVVTGLQPGTCYVFGVRAYSSNVLMPGKWTLLFVATDSGIFY